MTFSVDEGSAAYWDEQAASFDDEPDHGLRDPQVRSAWAALLEAVMPPVPATVADLGCGTGTLSCLLAERGCAVHGLDLSARMVTVARSKAAALGVDVRFEVGDAAVASPPLPVAAFDVVLVRHVLWAMSDPDAALASWIRLLRPGGRLVLVEGRWHTGDGVSAAQASALVLRHRQEAVLQALSDPTLWGRPIEDERYLLLSRA